MVVASTSLAFSRAVSRASSSSRMPASWASRRASSSIWARSCRLASSAVSPAIVSSLRRCSSSAVASRRSLSATVRSRVASPRSFSAYSASRRSICSSLRASSSSLARIRCSTVWISRSRRRASSSNAARALSVRSRTSSSLDLRRVSASRSPLSRTAPVGLMRLKLPSGITNSAGTKADYHACMPRVILISIDGLAQFYWTDPGARMPVLRALAERGAVAGGMATVFISTTWPSHVSLVTGVGPRVHGVVANHVLNRDTARPEDFTGDPVYDAADLVKAPTIYDRAHAAGLRTAAIDWPATRRAASLDFNLPFFKNQQIFEAHTAPAVWKELAQLGYPVDRQGEWAELPRRFLKDAMVADLAI